MDLWGASGWILAKMYRQCLSMRMVQARASFSIVTSGRLKRV